MHCWLLRGRLAALGGRAERLQGDLHPGHGEHRLLVVQPAGHRKADASLPPLAWVRYFELSYTRTYHLYLNVRTVCQLSLHKHVAYILVQYGVL